MAREGEPDVVLGSQGNPSDCLQCDRMTQCVAGYNRALRSLFDAMDVEWTQSGNAIFTTQADIEARGATDPLHDVQDELLAFQQLRAACCKAGGGIAVHGAEARFICALDD